MPRPVPEYKWPLVKCSKLKAEDNSHLRMEGKVKGKGYKCATAPRQLSKRSNTFAKEVHYGSSKSLLNSLQKL